MSEFKYKIGDLVSYDDEYTEEDIESFKKDNIVDEDYDGKETYTGFVVDRYVIDNVLWYNLYDNETNSHSSAMEDDLTHLPHCTYGLEMLNDMDYFVRYEKYYDGVDEDE